MKLIRKQKKSWNRWKKLEKRHSLSQSKSNRTKSKSKITKKICNTKNLFMSFFNVTKSNSLKQNRSDGVKGFKKLENISHIAATLQVWFLAWKLEFLIILIYFRFHSVWATYHRCVSITCRANSNLTWISAPTTTQTT